MADNVTIDNGQLTDFVGAADDVGGVLYQRVKIAHGTDGAATDASSSDPLPVTIAGGATAANQTTGNTSLGNIETGTGTSSDAAATAGSTGSINSKLRLITSQLDAGKTSLDTLANIVSAGRAQTDVLSLPAAARTTDAVAANIATDAIMNGLTALTPKFAKANVTASSTDSNIVSAVTSKKIRVLGFRLHAGSTATNVTFNSKPGGAGSAISELFACAANGGHHGAFCPVGHFETVAGEGLTVTTGAGSTVGIGVVYVEV